MRRRKSGAFPRSGWDPARLPAHCSHFPETKDYVYSTWNEGQLRKYLESKGIVNTPAQAKRDELYAQVKKHYNDAAENVYETWSDSYLVSVPQAVSESLHVHPVLLLSDAEALLP